MKKSSGSLRALNEPRRSLQGVSKVNWSLEGAFKEPLKPSGSLEGTFAKLQRSPQNILLNNEYYISVIKNTNRTHTMNEPSTCPRRGEHLQVYEVLQHKSKKQIMAFVSISEIIFTSWAESNSCFHILQFLCYVFLGTKVRPFHHQPYTYNIRSK